MYSSNSGISARFEFLAQWSGFAIVERDQSNLDDSECSSPGKSVLGRQAIAELPFSTARESSFVVDLIDLVQEHHQRWNANLTGKQDVARGLWHRAIGSRHRENTTHPSARAAGDHVLHLIGGPGAVDVGVVDGLRFSYSDVAVEIG